MMSHGLNYCLHGGCGKGSGWFGPKDPDRISTVGRKNTIVPPGGAISQFIEGLPAGYGFGAYHDGSLDSVAQYTNSSVADFLNYVSMPFAYAYAIGAEVLNTPSYIYNTIFPDNPVPVPYQYDYPINHQEPISP